MSDTVLLEQRGGVSILTLNRPASSNAFTPEMLLALYRVAEGLSDPSVRAVVITGSGRNFCAGADLNAAAIDPDGMDMRRVLHPVVLAFAALAKPVIGAINGAAAGGGLGLALSCDIRIMADDARLVPAWGEIGLAPDFGASAFAARLLGEARAFEWLAMGDTYNADKAVALGLAREKVAGADVVQAAIDLAQKLSDKPGDASALAKQLMMGAAHRDLAQQLEREAYILSLAVNAPGRMEQVAARMASFKKAKASK